MKQIVSRSSGFWVVNDLGVEDGPFNNIGEANAVLNRKFCLGDNVLVTIKTCDCVLPAGAEFFATVLDFAGDKYIVEDSDSECFTVEENELELRND